MTAAALIRRHRRRGFTLIEVMLALSLLGLALVVLVKSSASNMFAARQAQMMGVVTDLARAKMYDIEEKLLKDGFSDTDQSETSEQTFEEEGWPNITYTYKVDQVELPSWDKLQQLTQAGAAAAAGSGSGAGSGSDGSAASGGFGDSALGGMLSMLGGGFGGGGGDIDAQAGASFVQSQFQMFSDVLKASIRKVSLTVKWKVADSERDMTVVAYFTDAPAMDKVLSGLGSQDLDDAPGGAADSGSGGGTGATGGGRTGGGGLRSGGSGRGGGR
ncbi:MAG: prepilin-type N-terminal cleavage/methylation domain-containing protein [Kofleriaceae bacterium]